MTVGMTLLSLQLLLQIVAGAARGGRDEHGRRSDSSTACATLVVMFAGMPIAFALGAVATVFMIAFMPAASVDTITQNVYEEMASITLLSIPLFILKGAAIGRSRAGQDLYGALHAWMHRIPGRARHRQRVRLRAVRRDGGIVARDLLGDRLGRHSGDAQARLFRRASRPGIIAAGGTLGILLPPSITMILYAVAAEQSLGRLFLAAIGPALLLVALFAGYAAWRFRFEYRTALAELRSRPGRCPSCCVPDKLSLRDRFDAAAARAALRDPAHRRDDRALWRLRDPLGDRRPWRGSCSHFDCVDL